MLFVILTFKKASFTDNSFVSVQETYITSFIWGVKFFVMVWIFPSSESWLPSNLWKNCFELKLTLKSFVFTNINVSSFLLHQVSAWRVFAIWVLWVGYNICAINWLLLSKEEYLIIKAKGFCSPQRTSRAKWSCPCHYHIIYQL